MPTLDHDGERLSVDLVYLHMDMRDKKNSYGVSYPIGARVGPRSLS
jgi:hypothetical protein